MVTVVDLKRTLSLKQGSGTCPLGRLFSSTLRVFSTSMIVAGGVLP